MSKISYVRHRFPSVIIQRAVWLYFRFPLSFRDVEEVLAERQPSNVSGILNHDSPKTENFDRHFQKSAVGVVWRQDEHSVDLGGLNQRLGDLICLSCWVAPENMSHSPLRHVEYARNGEFLVIVSKDRAAA